jgi:hypothetical protein
MAKGSVTGEVTWGNEVCKGERQVESNMKEKGTPGCRGNDGERREHVGGWRGLIGGEWRGKKNIARET